MDHYFKKLKFEKNNDYIITKFFESIPNIPKNQLYIFSYINLNLHYHSAQLLHFILTQWLSLFPIFLLLRNLISFTFIVSFKNFLFKLFVFNLFLHFFGLLTQNCLTFLSIKLTGCLTLGISFSSLLLPFLLNPLPCFLHDLFIVLI